MSRCAAKTPIPMAAVLAAILIAGFSSVPQDTIAGMKSVVIEVPVSPKIDISDYNKMMVGSFVAEKHARLQLEDETIRYLKKMFLRQAVIDVGQDVPPTLPTGMESEAVFADTDYWSNVGTRFGCDLIITGKVSFSNEDQSGYENIQLNNTYSRYYQDPRSNYHTSQRTIFRERTGFYLNLEIFILNGSTGEEIHRDIFFQKAVYDGKGPDDLSVYFLMMDRMAPQVSGLIAERKTRVKRYLLD